MNLPFDLSGSTTKNRFRNEILWGLQKAFEVYETGEDFVIVFDYVCDIEVHLPQSGSFEFYQIKTQKDGESYTLNSILKRPKLKDDQLARSVLGKLYILKHNTDKNDEDTSRKVQKIAIVSNKPLKCADKTLHSSCSEVELSALGESSKEMILDSLKKEIDSLDDVDLDKVYFIYTSMDLFFPQQRIKGDLIDFFVRVRGVDPSRVSVLFSALNDSVTKKACHELKTSEYDALVKQKGLTREELDIILDAHVSTVDMSVEKATQFIEHEFSLNFGELIKWKKALSEVVRCLPQSTTLRSIEVEAITLFENNAAQTDSSRLQTVLQVSKNLSGRFPLEFRSESFMNAMALLAQCIFLEKL